MRVSNLGANETTREGSTKADPALVTMLQQNANNPTQLASMLVAQNLAVKTTRVNTNPNKGKSRTDIEFKLAWPAAQAWQAARMPYSDGKLGEMVLQGVTDFKSYAQFLLLKQTVDDARLSWTLSNRWTSSTLSLRTPSDILSFWQANSASPALIWASLGHFDPQAVATIVGLSLPDYYNVLWHGLTGTGAPVTAQDHSYWEGQMIAASGSTPYSQTDATSASTGGGAVANMTSAVTQIAAPDLSSATTGQPAVSPSGIMYMNSGSPPASQYFPPLNPTPTPPIPAPVPKPPSVIPKLLASAAAWMLLR